MSRKREKRGGEEDGVGKRRREGGRGEEEGVGKRRREGGGEEEGVGKRRREETEGGNVGIRVDRSKVVNSPSTERLLVLGALATFSFSSFTYTRPSSSITPGDFCRSNGDLSRAS